MCSDVFEEPQDVDCALVLDLLEHAVDDDVRASPPDTGAGTNRTQNLIVTESQPIEGAVSQAN